MWELALPVQAEVAALREQVMDLQQQLEAQQRQQQLGRSGRDSSLGRSVFLSSIQEAGKAAGSQPTSSSVPISWEDAAALPHDKLLQLVHALQLDLKAAQAEVDGTCCSKQHRGIQGTGLQFRMINA